MFHCCLINQLLLMILWRDVAETLMISMQTLMMKFFCCGNLRNIDVSLLLCRWSLMIVWRDILETVIVSMKLFLIFFCSECVKLWNIEVWLFLHWWFVDDSLKKRWWHCEGLDANPKDLWSLSFENQQNVDVPLLFEWLVVDDNLKRRWWDLDDLDANKNDNFFLC